MTLLELAAAAKVTNRTVRYYIAQGLLPAPVGAGTAALYTEEHLIRLRAIRDLQAQYLPLAEIRVMLVSEPTADYEVASSSALDYLNAMQGRGPQAGSAAPAQAQRSLGTSCSAEGSATRANWERHSFGPDIEIHIRRPLSRQGNRRADALLYVVRQFFQESP